MSKKSSVKNTSNFTAKEKTPLEIREEEEDKIWWEMSQAAEKEGYISQKETKKLMNSIKNA